MALSKIQNNSYADTAVHGRRNLIINGAMQVAQRGTSSTTNGYGSVDRFTVQYGGGTITHSQESLTSGSPYDNGFRKFLRATVTSAGSNAATDFCYLVQNVEAQNVAGSGWNYTSSSSYVTIQFWVRSSLAGTYYCVLKTVDGINRAFVIPVVLSANTWTKITQSISGDSNLQFDNDNGLGFEISVRPYVGTAYTDPSVNTTTWYTRSGTTQAPDYLQNWQSTGSATFDLTGVQLELGSTATPFEHRSYADELARCQRYYFETDKITGQVANASNAIFQGLFPTEMRANPSVSGGPYTIWQMTVGGSKAQSSANNSADSNQNNNKSFNIQCGNFSGLTQFYPVGIASGGPIKFDAEL